ncbi:hypothetical protein ES703_25962 [subsurface metagenome]
MMNKITKPTLLSLIISLFIAFILLLIFFYLYHGKNLGDEYRQVQSLKNALLLREATIHSLQFLPFVYIFINVLSFSVLFTLRPFHTDSFAYNNVAQPSYVLLIIFIMFIVSSEFVIIPKLAKENAPIKYRLRLAHRSASYAKELNTVREYEKAISVLNTYFEIDDNNQDMLDLYNNIMKILSKEPLPIDSTKKEISGVKEKVTVSYYEKGRTEYEKENYYSALYYLERALYLHKDNEELKELYKRCKGQVEDRLGKITKKEREKKRLIEHKERALDHLKNEEYYEAYNIFSDLNKMYPEMKDLSLYLETALRELEKKDFLPEELKNAEWLPSMNNIIFIDKQGYINTVERIIPYMDNFYFYNIRRHELVKGNMKTTHWKYGKWIKNKIRVKNDEGFKKIPEKDEGLHYIQTYIDPGYILYMNNSKELLTLLNIYERFSISENLHNSGFDIDNKYVYLSKKLGILFSVYVLSLFLSALAWARRSIYEFPPLLKLLLFILIVPVIAYFLHLLYIDMNNLIIYSHGYFTRVLFKNINVALYTAIVNLVFSLIATLYFLSQSSRVE